MSTASLGAEAGMCHLMTHARGGQEEEESGTDEADGEHVVGQNLATLQKVRKQHCGVAHRLPPSFWVCPNSRSTHQCAAVVHEHVLTARISM